MNIPVFHDDQHGTAIICTAAVINGLRIVKKDIGDVRLVVSGAGAASIACMNLLVALGLKRENITVCDSKGVIYKGRDEKMDATKAAYAIDDNGQRTLADAIPDADIFPWLLGTSPFNARNGENHGERSINFSFSEPRTRNITAVSKRSASRRDNLYRSFRLSKPSE
ncbi:NADP-dependent malic enzyme [Providencia rustigianii]|nr:NADP-dependent malic enzyme [Providencia rustigianii]